MSAYLFQLGKLPGITIFCCTFKSHHQLFRGATGTFPYNQFRGTASRKDGENIHGQAHKEMNIGGHLSTKEGFAKLPENAHALGLKTYQFFSKNQMQWKARPLDNEEALAHVKAAKQAGINDESIHASYLLNLGSPEEDKYKMSYGAFVEEIKRADQLGVPLLIFHPGAHMGSGEENALNSSIPTLESNSDRNESNLLLRS